MRLLEYCCSKSNLVLAIVLSEAATRLLWREMYYTLTRRTLLDFISAAEACFISWEIITIFIFYGKSAFTIFCFANLYQRSYRTGFYRGNACPYSHIVTYVNTRKDPVYGLHLKEALIRIGAQFLGGLFGYAINQTLWNLYLTPNHWYQSYNTSYGICWGFLHVDTISGFSIGTKHKSMFLCGLSRFF